ncbi:hypothetical protein [Streptosporangium pseudovulgare]|uniref:Uncharacterized protein n=1 Tax=Streptosporangium pseudovulgare TaxID=35765 RepID=A0ABQ2RH95_9ACTN|nr:hypothetical protein [Streptosporangium pseudovulgare]GGQ28968.1 hypothetical protein GCM10010140_68930 [Streptosporangium pseudovulgare]
MTDPVAGDRKRALKNLPEEVGGITLTSLSFAWRGFGFGFGVGHLCFSGTADRILGGLRFEARVRLYAEHGQVKVNAIRTRHDAGRRSGGSSRPVAPAPRP